MNKLDDVNVLYEDENFLVIDKPFGLVVHSDERTEEVTLCDFLDLKFPELKNVGRPHMLDNGRELPRYGMLTRLDRDTSGVILIAKNEKTFEFLQKQFDERSVIKKYESVVYGEMHGSGVMDKPIGRSKVDPRKWTTGDDIRNTKRDAVTEYKVIKNFENEKLGKLTLLELSPKTGRTHQIRVHLYGIGHPVIGDKRYHTFISDAERSDADHKNSIERMYLHAKSIEIENLKGERQTFESLISLEI